MKEILMKYRIKSNLDSRIIIEFTEETKFPGVELEYKNMKILDIVREDGKNCSLEYEILKVPEQKYQDMPSEMEEVFQQEVEAVFTELFQNLMEVVKQQFPNEKLEIPELE